MHSKKIKHISESLCSNLNPPSVAPKPKNRPSRIANLNLKSPKAPPALIQSHICIADTENDSLIGPDKAKLKALSKLGLLKQDIIPEKSKVQTLRREPPF